MRLNAFIAAGSLLSRRKADDAVAAGRVTVNGQPATPGMQVNAADVVMLDNRRLEPITAPTTILLHKPVGYVVSRNGQGSPTIYDLLPAPYQQLQPVGRLDKDSSGILLLTNDGQLANELTHPRHQKEKLYLVRLDRPLQTQDRNRIANEGVRLDDGISKLALAPQADNTQQTWIVRMHEGRNRQIRRTFNTLGYTVRALHRIQFGEYAIGTLSAGNFKVVKPYNSTFQTPSQLDAPLL